MKDEKFWICSEMGYSFQDHGGEDERYWQIVKSELDMLLTEGRANKIGQNYIITHDTAVSFSEEERETLGMPKVFPYLISIQEKNLFQNQQFQLEIYYLKPDKTPFVNPQVIGSFIRISDFSFFMFNKPQYEIVKAADKLRKEQNTSGSQQNIMARNMRYTSDIQKNAQKIDAFLTPYLKSDIVAPDKLSISVQKNEDGTYYISPVLLKKSENGYDPISEEDFNSRFHDSPSVKQIYTGKNRHTYVIFDDDQVDGLKQIKQHHRLKKEEAKRILRSPSSIFSRKTFVFDAQYYSERVEAYGEFIRKNLPYLPIQEKGWLPEEGNFRASETDGKEMPAVSPHNVRELERTVKIARLNEKNEFIWHGKKYIITEELIEKIKKIKSDEKDDSVTGVDNPSSEKQVQLFNQALIIKDNLSDLEYGAHQRKEQLLHGEMAPCTGLKDEIHLFDYQEEGIHWIWSNWMKGYKGVLLADDMGLGKTVQALGFIAGMKKAYGQNPMNSVLIVAPVSLLANWKEEYQKFVKEGIFRDIIELYSDKINDYDKDSLIYHDFSPIAKDCIVLTTYETLRINDVDFGRMDWSCMILDEAQKIKNPVSLICNTAKAMKYDFAVALTGTPVENAWIDLWSIMDFVVPGKLGSLREFNSQYQNRLKSVKNNSKELKKLGGQLEEQLKPVFLRRQKKDYLKDFPRKEIHKIEICMPREQRMLYRNIIESAKKEKGHMGQGRMFSIIAALRDVSLCPHLDFYNDQALAQMSCQDFFNSSARLQATFQTLVNIREKQEKALIFVTSRKMQRILKFFIDQVFHLQTFTPINGTVYSIERQRIIDKFNQSEGFNVLILSAEAGGVGFNITSANHVIHLSRCWNPAKEDQAIDRVYRIGQKKDVHVYIPIAVTPDYGKNGSFDEKLDQLLDFKRHLSESVIFPTGDSGEDGERIWGDLMGPSCKESSPVYGGEDDPWTVADTDKVKGDVFEHMIYELYNQMPGYTAEQTPQSNDNGADVVVYCGDSKERKGLLIQCKQTSTGKNIGPEGVEQICSALKWYEGQTGYQFQGIVITNAPGFTANAKERAEVNHIQLITRVKLEEMLKKYPMKKQLY